MPLAWSEPVKLKVVFNRSLTRRTSLGVCLSDSATNLTPDGRLRNARCGLLDVSGMSQIFDRVATGRERVEIRCRDGLLRLKGVRPLQQEATVGCGVAVVELQRGLLPQQLYWLASEFLTS